MKNIFFLLTFVLFSCITVLSWSFVLHDIPDYLRLDYIEYISPDLPEIRPKHIDHPTGLLDYELTQGEIDNLFACLDLEYPGLEEVRSAYDSEEYARALEELQEYFLNRETPMYFPDSFPENRPEPYPDYDTEEALAIMDHYFNFSGITGNPGSPIDWNYKEQNYLEWNFALNRLYFLYPLILAYWYTHDEVYANYAIEDFADWMVNGPSQYDRVLEYSIRVATMLDAYFYLRDLDSFSPDLHALFLLRLSEQGEYLKNNIPGGGWRSHWWYGSLLLSRMFPELLLSEDLLFMAEGIMEEFVDYNYYEDGYARTSSLMYHFFVETPHYIYLIELYHLNEWQVPGEDFLNVIFSTYGQAHLPDYHLPLFGDGEQRSPDLLRAYMLKVAELTGSDSMRFLATKGEEGTEPENTSIVAPESRLLFLRRDWTKDSPTLAVNIGYGEGWHSHNDFLSFIFYLNEQELIRDSGIRSYETEDRYRFRLSRMHNIPEIEQLGQESWEIYPPTERGEIEFVYTGNMFDLVQASILYPDPDGEGVTFTRRYFFFKEENCLVLVDSFSDREKQVTQYFQIGIDYNEVIPGTDYITMNNGERTAYLIPDPKPPGITSYYGSEDPFLGWYCEKFHEIQPAHTVALHYYPPLPANMIFFLRGDDSQPDYRNILQYDQEEGTWGMELVFGNRSYFIIQTPAPGMMREIDSFQLEGFFAFMMVEDGIIQELESDGTLFHGGQILETGGNFPQFTFANFYYLLY